MSCHVVLPSTPNLTFHTPKPQRGVALLSFFLSFNHRRRCCPMWSVLRTIKWPTSAMFSVLPPAHQQHASVHVSTVLHFPHFSHTPSTLPSPQVLPNAVSALPPACHQHASVYVSTVLYFPHFFAPSTLQPTQVLPNVVSALPPARQQHASVYVSDPLLQKFWGGDLLVVYGAQSGTPHPAAALLALALASSGRIPPPPLTLTLSLASFSVCRHHRY